MGDDKTQRVVDTDPPLLRRGDCMILTGAILCAQRLLAGDHDGAMRAANYFAIGLDAGKDGARDTLARIEAVNDAIWGAMT